MNFYYYVCFFVATASFVFLEGHLFIKKAVTSKYRKWRELNSLVSTTHQNKHLVVWVSIKILCKMMYINFIQYAISKSIRKLSKNKYELSYVIRGRLYKMIITQYRGPSPVLQVINEAQEDVTDDIIPYMGPQYNWHKSDISPALLGYNTLIFELGNGKEKIYKSTEIMDLLL